MTLFSEINNSSKFINHMFRLGIDSVKSMSKAEQYLMCFVPEEGFDREYALGLYIKEGRSIDDLVYVAKNELKPYTDEDLNYHAESLIDVVQNLMRLGITKAASQRVLHKYFLEELPDEDYGNCSDEEGIALGFNDHFENGGTADELLIIVGNAIEHVDIPYSHKAEYITDIQTHLYKLNVRDVREYDKVVRYLVTIDRKGSVVEGFNTYYSEGGTPEKLIAIAKSN